MPHWYSPTQSRWWTPDPAGLAAVDPEDPQSWNRYAYDEGIPAESIDTSGEGCPIVFAGVNEGPETGPGQRLLKFALQNGWYVVFPYAGTSFLSGAGDVFIG